MSSTTPERLYKPSVALGAPRAPRPETRTVARTATSGHGVKPCWLSLDYCKDIDHRFAAAASSDLRGPCAEE